LARISLEPLRGMRDYVPPESEELSYIESTFAETARLFGYREVRPPTVERFELFALKSGEEIRRSMYVFRDKAGREVALRPELTPSVVRIYLRELTAQPKPIRLYYVGSVFRYDEPQMGRYREFRQGGVEILGADSLYHDIELVWLLEEFYDRLGLRNRVYKVNNMAIPKKLAYSAKLSDDEVDTFLHLLDKAMFDRALDMLRSRGADREARVLERLAEFKRIESVSKLVEILDEIREIYPEILDEVQALIRYFEEVRKLGVNAYVDLSFARGIAYYTGIVFEVQVPELPISIAGGGRYDNLTRVYGGPELRLTGFAIGIERTLLALKKQGVEIPIRGCGVLAVVIGLERLRIVKGIVDEVRRRGVCVQLEVVESPRRLSRVLDYASRMGFEKVIIVGGREVEKGVVVLRDMRRWEQREIPIDRVAEAIVDGARAC